MRASTGSSSRSRFSAAWIAVAVVFVCLVIAALLLPMRMLHGSMRMPVAMSPAELGQAVPNQTVDLVVQVQRTRPDGPALARLLRLLSGSEYARTSSTVWIERSSATKTVMGNERDVTSGAVLQVHATTTGRTVDRSPVVEASQIIIITGFASVR